MFPRGALSRCAWDAQVLPLLNPYVLLTGFGTFFRSHLMVDEFQFGKSTRRWLRLKSMKLTISHDNDARTYGPIGLKE